MSQDFPWKGQDEIDEAVTEGWLYIREQWAHQRATARLSVKKRWPFAMRTLLLRAKDHLAAEAERPEVPVSALTPTGLTPEEENDFIDNLFGEAAGADPALAAAEQDLLHRSARLIEALRERPEEWDAWVRDLVEGLTLREAATRQGVNDASTIMRRRNSGLERIRPLLTEHGLIKETP